MVIFQTLLSPVFEWLKQDGNQTIRKPDQIAQFLNGKDRPCQKKSLDPFGMNKIFVMTLLLTKRSRLIDHSKTGPNFSAKLNHFAHKKYFFCI
jgi:hypothetical protein